MTRSDLEYGAIATLIGGGSVYAWNRWFVPRYPRGTAIVLGTLFITVGLLLANFAAWWMRVVSGLQGPPSLATFLAMVLGFGVYSRTTHSATKDTTPR